MVEQSMLPCAHCGGDGFIDHYGRASCKWCSASLELEDWQNRAFELPLSQIPPGVSWTMANRLPEPGVLITLAHGDVIAQGTGEPREAMLMAIGRFQELARAKQTG